MLGFKLNHASKRGPWWLIVKLCQHDTYDWCLVYSAILIWDPWKVVVLSLHLVRAPLQITYPLKNINTHLGDRCSFVSRITSTKYTHFVKYIGGYISFRLINSVDPVQKSHWLIHTCTLRTQPLIFPNHQGLILLTWINFNPSMNK